MYGVALRQQIECIPYRGDNNSHRLGSEQHSPCGKGHQTALRRQWMFLLHSLPLVLFVPVGSRKRLKPELFPSWSQLSQMFLYCSTNVEVELTDTQVIVFPDRTQEHCDDG